MGYCSDIRCLIYPKNVQEKDTSDTQFDALKLIMNTTFKDVFDMWSEDFMVDAQHRVIDFSIENVKWYESFPDVSAFDAMLPEIEELGFCYEFVRVGEDNGDVEFRQSADNNCYLNTTTSITCYF